MLFFCVVISISVVKRFDAFQLSTKKGSHKNILCLQGMTIQKHEVSACLFRVLLQMRAQREAHGRLILVFIMQWMSEMREIISILCQRLAAFVCVCCYFHYCTKEQAEDIVYTLLSPGSQRTLGGGIQPCALSISLFRVYEINNPSGVHSKVLLDRKESLQHAELRLLLYVCTLYYIFFMHKYVRLRW